MARRKKIYEGKAKILYEGPEPGTIVQYFKDDATAFNAEKKDVIEGKGVLNNRLSEFFMTGLNNIGVPTHFLKRPLVRKAALCKPGHKNNRKLQSLGKTCCQHGNSIGCTTVFFICFGI